MENGAMKLSEELLRKLNRKYEPAATLPLHHRNQDIVIRTDKEGNAIQAFIGRATADGTIKGDRYSRSLVRDRQGRVIKDYWERKGKAS